MTLMAMLFVLVFVTELISWIGQSVLLEFVRGWACSYVSETDLLLGFYLFH